VYSGEVPVGGVLFFFFVFLGHVGYRREGAQKAGAGTFSHPFPLIGGVFGVRGVFPHGRKKNKAPGGGQAGSPHGFFCLTRKQPDPGGGGGDGRPFRDKLFFSRGGGTPFFILRGKKRVGGFFWGSRVCLLLIQGGWGEALLCKPDCRGGGGGAGGPVGADKNDGC